ncbi:MAG: rod shape-determining protein MreD [Deltaproteobacteria bacterium]
MNRWAFALIIVIFTLIQVTVLDYFRIFGTKPDLILIAVVITSLFCDLKWAISLSIAAGILKDSFTTVTFPLNSLLLPLWSFLAIKLSRRFSLDVNFVRAILIFIIAVFNAVAVRMIYLYTGTLVSLGIFLRIALLGSFYTALASLLIFKVLKIR